MIFPIGNELVANVDFLSLPINDNDIIIVVRNSNVKQPLAIRWKDFRSGLANALNVLQDGNLKTSNPKNINFTGSGVTVTDEGDTATINIPGGGGGSLELQTEGTPNAVQTLLNFIAGDYIAIHDDGSGGEVFTVGGLLSAEIVVAEMNSVINLADQSDNHATQVNMGTWDGLSLFNIVYNTKLNPKDGSIIEVVISDTFSTDNLGPGSVELTIKYGLTIIFSGTVDADRAIRFRYEADTDEWFPVSYASASSFTPGGSGTVTSVGISVPAAFSVSGSPVTGSGTMVISAVGAANQYIKGDGSLGDSISETDVDYLLVQSFRSTYNY